MTSALLAASDLGRKRRWRRSNFSKCNLFSSIGFWRRVRSGQACSGALGLQERSLALPANFPESCDSADDCVSASPDLDVSVLCFTDRYPPAGDLAAAANDAVIADARPAKTDKRELVCGAIYSGNRPSVA